MDTRTKITGIVQRMAGSPVHPEAGDSLFESGLLDSFTLTDLVAELEREFAIRIPDSDLTPRRFDSVSRIEAYLQGHQ